MKTIHMITANCPSDFSEGIEYAVGEDRLCAEHAMLQIMLLKWSKYPADTKEFYGDSFDRFKHSWMYAHHDLPVHPRLPRWQTVFKDFDYDYVALIEELGPDWKDDTWRNDTCPKASYFFNNRFTSGPDYVNLFFDYNDPNLSEHSEVRNLLVGGVYKFGLCTEFGDYICQTDDWAEMKDFVQNKLKKWFEDNYQSGE